MSFQLRPVPEVRRRIKKLVTSFKRNPVCLDNHKLWTIRACRQGGDAVAQAAKLEAMAGRQDAVCFNSWESLSNPRISQASATGLAGSTAASGPARMSGRSCSRLKSRSVQRFAKYGEISRKSRKSDSHLYDLLYKVSILVSGLRTHKSCVHL